MVAGKKMISDKYNCIFIHIPKTAGTSIEKALGHFDVPKRGVQDHRSISEIEPVLPIDLFKSLRQGDPFLLYRKLKKIIKDEKIHLRKKYNQYFKFAFVRNPWARVFSWYKNVIRDEVHRNRFGISAGCTFKEFLEFRSDQYEINPQMYWIKDKNNQIPLDFIGRFENLVNDFNYVAEIIGLENRILPKLVVGEKSSYTEYYDPAMIDIVNNKYSEEINYFKFEYGR